MHSPADPALSDGDESGVVNDGNEIPGHVSTDRIMLPTQGRRAQNNVRSPAAFPLPTSPTCKHGPNHWAPDDLSFRSAGCRRPNAARLGAGVAGRRDRHARSSAGSGERGGASPSSVRSAADPPQACGGRGSSGNTTGTSRADRRGESSPFARQTDKRLAGVYAEIVEAVVASSGESFAPTNQLLGNSSRSRSCTCRRTRRGEASRGGSVGLEIRIKVAPRPARSGRSNSPAASCR